MDFEEFEREQEEKIAAAKRDKLQCRPCTATLPGRNTAHERWEEYMQYGSAGILGTVDPAMYE